jgi:hypothetical protein
METATNENDLSVDLSVETCWRDAVSKPFLLVNFLQALLAIILGNVVYFVLVPSLPPVSRHRPFQLDLGMLLDFSFCVVAYGLIRTARKWR